MKRRTVRIIRVFRSPLHRSRGRLVAGALDIPCALGRAGTTRDKREGDGATPIGRFRVLSIRYRPDRLQRPRTGVPVISIRPDDGWCDDPRSRHYNQPVRLPSPAGHEIMWRDDPLYDVVLDLDWNRSPPRAGRGSAIFLHACRAGYSPTEGCVAVEREKLLRLSERIGRRTRVHVVG